MEAIPINNCPTTLPSRTQDVLPSRRLCKNLFGPVDHEEIGSILDAELNRDTLEKSVEWCFNFAEGTPITNGKLVWEEIGARKEGELSTKSQKVEEEESRVPELHSEADLESQDDVELPRRGPVKTIPLKKSPDATVETTKVVSKLPSTEERKRKKQCRTITDFMKQRKRRRVSRSSVAEKNCNSIESEEPRCAQDDLTLSSPVKKVKVSS